MNKLDTSATGVYLITVTPFTDSGALDLASTDRMVDFCLASGVTGLTVLGIMGEATKLTAEESRCSSSACSRAWPAACRWSWEPRRRVSHR